MTPVPRVLVVEDEPHIRELVCLHLGLEGYTCEGVGDGQAALKRAEAERYDLMVLDVMIPGLDGLSLCRAVRNGRTNRDVPILMLTARREESDKVIGLESGADDYLTKPFGVRELVARARALMRRPRQATAGAAAANGDEMGPPITVHGIDATRTDSPIGSPVAKSASATVCPSTQTFERRVTSDSSNAAPRATGQARTVK